VITSAMTDISLKILYKINHMFLYLHAFLKVTLFTSYRKCSRGCICVIIEFIMDNWYWSWNNM